MCGWGRWMESYRRWASRGWRGRCVRGSRGPVFQTGSPYRQETEGPKTPAIRGPSYGWGCIGMQPHAGFVCQRKEILVGIWTVAQR